MRALDILTLDTKDFTLLFPQDGIDQPATYRGPGSSRSIASTLSVLTRPVKGDPLASVATLKLDNPIVRTVNEVSTTVGVHRLELTSRNPSLMTDAEYNDYISDLIAVISSASFKKALGGERLS